MPSNTIEQWQKKKKKKKSDSGYVKNRHWQWRVVTTDGAKYIKDFKK